MRRNRIMIDRYCGDCGEPCEVQVEYENGIPVRVESECCGAEVYANDLLTRRVDTMDYDPRNNPFVRS